MSNNGRATFGVTELTADVRAAIERHADRTAPRTPVSNPRSMELKPESRGENPRPIAWEFYSGR